MLRPLADRQLDHPGSDVETDDVRPRRCQGERDVAGAGCKIQCATACHRLRQRREAPLPSAILAIRECDGDEIVSIRDRGEQRSHEAALAIWSRQGLAERNRVSVWGPKRMGTR